MTEALAQVNPGASGHPQFVQSFDGNTSLAFTISDGGVPEIISSMRYQRGGSWLAVRWPSATWAWDWFFGMNTIQRVSADEYWTIGLTGTSQSACCSTSPTEHGTSTGSSRRQFSNQ